MQSHRMVMKGGGRGWKDDRDIYTATGQYRVHMNGEERKGKDE